MTGTVMPIRDRAGRQVEVGDAVRMQICVGRYGQVALVQGKS